MALIDQPRAVRAGEELDAVKVDAYLRQIEPALEGLEGPLEIAQYPGGASNLTYLLRYPQRELVLRRPPFGHKAKSAHDMMREAQVMAALKPHYPYVPQVVAICKDPAVLGADFFVMERLRGIIPRKDLPKELVLDSAQTRTLCLNVIDRLIELHQVDYQAAGLSALGKGEGYVERQISGWSDRFRRARTEDVGDFEAVMAWLANHMPSHHAASCLIHNDYRFDNVVLDPDDPLRVIGVLDWEMATIGDPLMDLGNTLAYWVEAGDDETRMLTRRQPTHLPGMLTRKEVIEYYGQKMGLPIDSDGADGAAGPAGFAFYEVYGLFRLAVIAQQIYYRFFHKQTDNPEFAGFADIVRYLEQRCRTQIG